MTPNRDNPLIEILYYLLQMHDADFRVALPGKVTRVDASKGLVDVKPLLQSWKLDGANARIPVSIPVQCGVPLIYPGGGGLRITFPVKVGDTVQLVFNDRSMDRWKSLNDEVDPMTETAHSLADAVAYPGLRSFKNPWLGVDQAAVTIGTDGTSFVGAGLGPSIRTELDALWDAVLTHIHTVATTGTATAQTGTAAAETNKPKVAQTVTSTTVKVST